MVAAGKPRVAFLHPDLGLGGAERLIVDFVVELQGQGYEVDMYTAHHDPHRCFEETLQGGERGKRASWVHVHGAFIPRNVLGRFHALLAYVRCLWAALAIALCSVRYDVVVVDQVSAPILVLRLLTRAKVLFYCHFPDLLLAQRSSTLRALYRAPLDILEEVSTGCAHEVLVNSKYTADVFAKTFRRLHRVRPSVLYPAVDVEQFLNIPAPPIPYGLGSQGIAKVLEKAGLDIPTGRQIFLSINRFERKKGLALAIRAFALLRHEHLVPMHLVLAGGYDERLAENREHLEELRKLAQKEGIAEHVTFVPSFTADQRTALLVACLAVLYTPQNEHFGIVPLEGMAAGRAVCACNSGGPLESIVDNVTGFLCEPSPESFVDSMAKLLDTPVAAQMGIAARMHVQRKFSRSAMGKELGQIVERLKDASDVSTKKD